MLLFNPMQAVFQATLQYFNTSNVTIQLYADSYKISTEVFQYI